MHQNDMIVINNSEFDETDLQLLDACAVYKTELPKLAITARRSTAICQLCRAGYMKVLEKKTKLVQNADSICILLEQKTSLFGYYCELSTAGIEVWQSLFRRDWSSFFETRWYGIPPNERVLFACGSQEQCFKMFAGCVDYYGFDNSFGLQDVRFGVLENWHATYWKVMQGYFASASFRRNAIQVERAEMVSRIFTLWGGVVEEY